MQRGHRVWWSPSLRGSTVTTAFLGRLKSVLEKTAARATAGSSRELWAEGNPGQGGVERGWATENPLRRWPLFHPQQAQQLTLSAANAEASRSQ